MPLCCWTYGEGVLTAEPGSCAPVRSSSFHTTGVDSCNKIMWPADQGKIRCKTGVPLPHDLVELVACFDHEVDEYMTGLLVGMSEQTP